MKEDEVKKNRNDFLNTSKKRIKIGLILNQFGEENKINVEEHEIQAEVQKQLRMMPGQEKMVMEFYQKNPSALASLRGNVYEEKIINFVKNKAKVNKKDISKVEAEKIIKDSHSHDDGKNKKVVAKSTAPKDKKAKSEALKTKKTKPLASKAKKVSKK